MDGNFVFRFEDKPCVCSFCGQPSGDRCLLGYGKKEVAYLCSSCYRTLQDIIELHVDVVRHRDSLPEFDRGGRAGVQEEQAGGFLMETAKTYSI